MIKKFENFTNTQKISIVTFEMGEYVKALYIDGELFKYGDYYHDKIETLFEGFILGIKHAGIPFELEKINCSNEETNQDVCENGNTPPKKLSEI